MITLNVNSIRLNNQASNKQQAIELVGQVLVSNGNMKSEYIASMFEREQVANTYLGNGIAIPHGMTKDRDYILNTGIAIAQFPDGVQWSNGEKVYLVVGIAAKSDEHIEVLTNLTHVLDDEQAVKQLASTTNVQDIIDCLQGKTKTQTTIVSAQEDYACYEDVVFPGKAGLHARPATALVDLAKTFQADIKLRCGEKSGNAKSLVSLLKVGVTQHATVRIMAQGYDEKKAVRTLAQAVIDGLEKEEEHDETDYDVISLALDTPCLKGLGGSPGVAIAPLYHFKHETISVEREGLGAEEEKKRLHQAIENAQIQLKQLYEEVRERSGVTRAAIFQAHQEFLLDPELSQEAISVIEQGTSAGWAWRQTIDKRVAEISALGDKLLSERANDLQDVGRRVLRVLANEVQAQPDLPKTPIILLAHDLTPSDTAKLDPTFILGICTAAGGPTSHTAIIARSLDIPAIVGVGAEVLKQEAGVTAILNGDDGSLYVNPTESDLSKARAVQEQWMARRNEESLACYQPALLKDGERVEIVANAGSGPEAEQAINAGAEGIGLLRTEFLFLERDSAPTEDEQFDVYSHMAKTLNGLPLIIRTLDIGGDKEVSYMNLPKEENPFLGIRGVRLCFEQLDLFRTQLRAIYRAAQYGDIKIMFPMISTVEDLYHAKAIAEDIRQELNARQVDIGIMIEVPSAVMMAKELAQEADFFSVGTNDLTQYVLAMDRLHPSLARQADALHPAVLRMINLTVEAAQEAGIWVGVCGGVAGDPKGAAILTGLGVAELSMSIPSVAAIKAKLRKMSMAQCRQLAQRALQCKTASQVRAL